MSNVSYQQGSLTQIYSDDCPPTVKLLSRYIIDWSQQRGDNKALFNFDGVVPAAIRGLQGVYIDNSSCALDATFTDPLGNNFTVKAGWEAMLPCWYFVGGAATVSVVYSAAEVLIGSLGQQTALEFLNEAPANVDMWQSGAPVALIEQSETTIISSYNFGAVSEGVFYTNIEATISATNVNTAMSFSQGALIFAGSALIERILGGVIMPAAPATQGATAFYGALSVFSASNPSGTGVASNRSQANWPVNLVASQAVPAAAIPETKTRFFTNNQAAANGIPACGMYCMLSNNSGAVAIPSMIVNLAVKVRVLS